LQLIFIQRNPSLLSGGKESVPIQLSQCWFPVSKAKILNKLIKWNTRKQFYQTAVGNCYGLKLQKCWLQFKKNKFLVSYCNFTHTLVPCSERKSVFSFLRMLTMWHCPPHKTAAECRPCSNRSISPTRRVPGLLLWAHAGTDRQTPYHYIDPAPKTMQAVPISLWDKRYR